MTDPIRDSLAQVQELLGRATPGPYESYELPSQVSEIFSDGDFNIYPPLGETGPVAVASGQHNATAIVAAVNWLREHGPELMKRLDRHGAGDAEDAARYRWIKDRSMNKSVMDSKQQNGPFIAVGSILTGWATPNDIDSAIDAARAGERG